MSRVSEGQSRLPAKELGSALPSGPASQAPAQTLTRGVGSGWAVLGGLGSQSFSISTGHVASAVTPTPLGFLVCTLGPVIPPGQVRAWLGEMV